MEINNPENVETVAEPTPGDQPESPKATTDGPTLASIVAAHVETHTGFDPTIHASNEDGSPKRKADGSYAMKRGRKAGGSLPPKSGSAQVKDAATPVQEDMRVQVAPERPRMSPEQAARQSANLLINGCVLLCGEQIGTPKDKAEAEGLLFSFKDYYEARGVPNLPPEIGLLIGVSMYVIPRVRESETAKGKITRLIEWAKSKMG